MFSSQLQQIRRRREERIWISASIPVFFPSHARSRGTNGVTMKEEEVVVNIQSRSNFTYLVPFSANITYDQAL